MSTIEQIVPHLEGARAAREARERLETLAELHPEELRCPNAAFEAVVGALREIEAAEERCIDDLLQLDGTLTALDADAGEPADSTRPTDPPSEHDAVTQDCAPTWDGSDSQDDDLETTRVCS